LTQNLRQGITALHQTLRRQVAAKWKRSLPFADELFDRWERAEYLRFGKGASIYDSSIVIGDVSVGENTWIGPNTILDGSGGLSIGKYCSISTGVSILTHDSVKWALSGGKESYDKMKTIIEDCCFIGSNTIIEKGVHIGKHSLIGALSFVNCNVPPFSIAFGVPCRIRGKVKIENGQVEILYDK